VNRKVAVSTHLPVKIARPVFGQLIISMPMKRAPAEVAGVCVPLLCEEMIQIYDNTQFGGELRCHHGVRFDFYYTATPKSDK
jgi:hypothetical protein